MAPPVPHSSTAIRGQIAAVELLIRDKGRRRDALRLGPSSPQAQRELEGIEREIARLWQGKEYWQRMLEARLAWEHAISGAPPRPPKILPMPDLPPAWPRFEVEGYDRGSPPIPQRTWLPYIKPPFPFHEFPTPPSASDAERDCIKEWNKWRDRVEERWDQWMRDLRRWDEDMFFWDQQRRRALQNGETPSSNPPPRKPELNLPETPNCPRPSSVYL
jgi:hypothetical protein